MSREHQGVIMKNQKNSSITKQQALRRYYKGQFVLITGGSEGIGASLAKYLTLLGANVFIVSRNPSKLNIAMKNMEDLRQDSHQILQAISLNVSHFSNVEKTLNNIFKKENHHIDLVINSAGYSHPAFFVDTPIETFHDMMNVNYFGTVNVLKVMIPYMIKNKKGQILNVSSMAGYLGLFGYSGYCGTKFAVIGLSEALKRELKPYNISVSVLCPPATQTAGFDQENKIKPQEIFDIEKKATILTADQVAQETLKQLRSRRFLINPSFDSKVAYLLNRFAPFILELFVKRSFKS